jgi:hypothetical protein
LKKLLLLLFLVQLSISCVNAQTRPYGKIDTADLKLTSCAFDKGANAMVLFDKAEVTYKYSSIIMERHKRIKILSDKGKDEANIRIEFNGTHKDEEISDIMAETINLNDNTIEYISIEKKLIYSQVVDDERKALIIAFPNVKAGSVIEFKYKWSTPYGYNYPDWYFQGGVPCRYSEFNATFINDYSFNILKNVRQPFIKDTAVLTQSKAIKHSWALSNIKAYKAESFMDYTEDYLQSILFKIAYKNRTWETIGKGILNNAEFGEELNKSLNGEEEIITKANALPTNDEKIAYIFSTVKNTMNWNKINRWYTIDGVRKAWNKKAGNSTEINLILYNLLKSVNISTFLMVLSTRQNGKIDPAYPSISPLNKTVVYCPIDSSKYYVLDASNPYNTYNNIPLNLTRLYVLSIDAGNKRFGMFQLREGSAREVILINGKVNTDGTIEGNAQISSFSYDREKHQRQYDDLGEKGYVEKLQGENNSLKITGLRLENMKNDTLPFIQTFDFKMNLTEPDGVYMYLTANFLTGFRINPFISETRISNIDFGCPYHYSINERFKIPPGYKVDALPKTFNLLMPDKSIIFKRAAAEQDGEIIVQYTIAYKKSLFSSDEYPSLREFYKKMYEMLNEQIVLKKS